MDKIFSSTFLLGKHERLGTDSPINLLFEWELRQIYNEYKAQMFYDEQEFLNKLYGDDFCYGIY